MSATLYDQGYVFIDGALLSQNQEFALSLEGDDQDVETVPLQWAGITQTPKKSMLTLKSAQPPKGFEFDPFNSVANSIPHVVKLQLAASGKSYRFNGFARKPKLEGGVGKSLAVDWEFHGEVSTWV